VIIVEFIRKFVQLFYIYICTHTYDTVNMRNKTSIFTICILVFVHKPAQVAVVNNKRLAVDRLQKSKLLSVGLWYYPSVILHIVTPGKAVSRLSRQCGILTILQLSGPPQPVMGIALLYSFVLRGRRSFSRC
jgi:hypothetical protein